MLLQSKHKNSTHSRTIETLPNRRKLHSVRQCCKGLKSSAVSGEHSSNSPFKQIIQNLQEQLERKGQETRSLRKRVRELQSREIELSQQLDTIRKRELKDQASSRSVPRPRTNRSSKHSQKDVIQKLQAEVARLQLRMTENSKQAQQLKDKILAKEKQKEVLRQAEQVSTRRRDDGCREGWHTPCCTSSTMVAKMEALKQSGQIEQLKQKISMLQNELQNKKEQSVRREESVRVMKRDFENRYSDLLLQLNRLIKQLK